VKEKVATALDKVRPFLQRDGGDVELIDVTEDGLVNRCFTVTQHKKTPEGPRNRAIFLSTFMHFSVVYCCVTGV